jgi:hypothetical protein
VTGRFYHADERPPLHKEDEILFEQRVPDGTLNHLRFAADGSIFLQRDITKPEDNSEARATIKIDGETGNVEIKPANDLKTAISIDGETGDVRITSGEKIFVALTHDDNIDIMADGQPITVNCDTMKVTAANGMTIEGNLDVKGDLKVSADSGPSTTISGNEITGA